MPQNRKKRGAPQKGRRNQLDKVSEKRGRGRPGGDAAEIRGRADDYRLKLRVFWDAIREPVLEARTEGDILAAFAQTAEYNARPFVAPDFPGLILKIIHEPKFPKRSKTQIGFLADSLAGLGKISPRRSRDVCAEQRPKDVPLSQHRILRWEFYIECSCGYKGAARDNACRKCGAVIPSDFQLNNPKLFAKSEE